MNRNDVENGNSINGLQDMKMTIHPYPQEKYDSEQFESPEKKPTDLNPDNVGFYRGCVLLDKSSLKTVRYQIETIEKRSRYGYEPFVCTGKGWVINTNCDNPFVYMLKREKTIFTLMMMTVDEAVRANAYIYAKEQAGMPETGKGWRWEMDVPK